MPQPLARRQPTSSVAAMLDRGVGACLVAKAPAPTPPISAASADSARPSPQSRTIPRQFLLSSAADMTLKRLQAIFAEATGLELRQSEILRAMLLAYDGAMPAVEREARAAGPLRRPKNGPGSEVAQAELEQRIAAIFSSAGDQVRR